MIANPATLAGVGAALRMAFPLPEEPLEWGRDLHCPGARGHGTDAPGFLSFLQNSIGPAVLRNGDPHA
jgi:hypothetical protein